MVKAVWNGAVLAESDGTVVVEGNHYVPPEALRREYFRESDSHTRCGWKGQASYYDVVVGSTVNKDAAWYYPHPKDAAREIAGRVAFWHGVEVTDDGRAPAVEASASGECSSGAADECDTRRS